MTPHSAQNSPPRWASFRVAASLLALVTLWLPVSCESDSSPASVLLISIDTLRADHLGCYGYAPYDEPVSPAIDKLAVEGTRFDHFYVPRGQTAPSLCSMMVGAFPSTHGVRENAQQFRGDPATMAECFEDAGYDTAAFISYVPAHVEGHPSKGFQLSKVTSEGKHGPAKKSQKSSWDRQASRLAMKWLRERDSGSAPFFVWTHFYQVHRPYLPPPPYHTQFTGDYRGQLYDANPDNLVKADAYLDFMTLADRPLSDEDHEFILALYDGGIRATDQLVKELLDTLEEQGLSDNTLVVVTADHGEDLGDHHRYYFHGNSVYDSTLRVPLVMRWPGRIPAGQVVSDLAQNVDLFPTLTELVLGEATTTPENVSHAPRILRPDQGSGARDYVYSEWQDLVFTIRDEQWKYVFNPQGIHPKKPPYYHRKDSLGYPLACQELYQVSRDPAEQKDLAAQESSVVPRLRGLIHDFNARPQRIDGWATTVDPEEIEKIKALGYVGSVPGRPDVVFNAEECGRD